MAVGGLDSFASEKVIADAAECNESIASCQLYKDAGRSADVNVRDTASSVAEAVMD
jgi:hypothetical protein